MIALRVGACAVLLVALLWGYRGHVHTQALQATIDSTQADLEASQATVVRLQQQAAVTAAQVIQRDTLREPVKQAAKAVKHRGDNEVRPTASDAQLDRLRVLAAAANAAAASAASLP